VEYLVTQIVVSLIGTGIIGIIIGILSMNSKIKELHAWHDVNDEEGVKIWYTRNKTVEDTLEKMTEILDRMDRRDERSLLIQNHQIEVLERHTETITKLAAVVEALVVLTKRNGR
jgi:hypothetical protein